MKNIFLFSIIAIISGSVFSQAVRPCAIKEYTDIWPSVDSMPNKQKHQIAVRERQKPPAGCDIRMPRLEWYEPPLENENTRACMILISGGAYQNCCDGYWVDWLARRLVQRGVTCVSLIYRTPRPKGLEIFATAWQDGQRAVRIVRSEAAKRGYDPEKIGVMGFSAGAHLTLMLATSSQTNAYEKLDALDDLPCHVNIAVPIYPAYVLNDGLTGPNKRDGDAPDIKLSSAFKFDSKTPPMSFFHGGVDIYSPNGTTQIYRQLRRMGVPAEVHIYPDRNHGFFAGAKKGSGAANWYGRIEEFLVQTAFLGPVPDQVPLSPRIANVKCKIEEKQDIWPEGKTPDFQDHQEKPYIEWYVPSNLTTKAIQIIYSGGGYNKNSTGRYEVAPVRRYLNAKGMAVVTLKYRSPRPNPPLPKHLSAWQDLQRAIRIVRSQAESKGLDPNKIGIMGSSAGGHLSLLGATSSMRNSYYRGIDKIDKLPCNVQWAIAVYPAYSIVGPDGNVDSGPGNEDTTRLSPELSFDLNTCPTLFLHGDADPYTAMNSVKCWEQMRRMGVQGELHTLALRTHSFQAKASPGTGSYTWIDRIWEFLVHKGFDK
ncbi:MAG: alpha/beta hydrolase [Kiritimatiellae bacterium]|nr:alpha/beta hydrolase [Kiritimatiellia bacterium]